MKITFNSGEYDLARPIDISIPLWFNGPQPNAYGVEPASSSACEYGSLVGDTRRGGSCNFESYTFIPHCNGTHTECVGHITNERISVRECLTDALLEAHLISVEPAGRGETGESYSVEIARDDRVITKTLLTEALAGKPVARDQALIVRTLPNDDGKLSRAYDETQVPPYFTTEAMSYIAEAGFKHLVVDLPSIDRLYDEGKLLNHRIFWHMEDTGFEAGPGARRTSTVTELVYVPGEVADGRYLLNLQIAPFAADCAPSRPLLFERKDIQP